MITIVLVSLLAAMVLPLSAFHTTSRHMIHTTFPCRALSSSCINASPLHMLSSWDNFAYDDDDELLEKGADEGFVAADENDDPSVKAAVGMALEPPEVDYDGPIIQVPQGSQLELSEETVEGVLAACREEIGTMFGYQAENRGVGITGGVDFVELDGPTVVLHLKGRFWHQRPTVLARVGAYLKGRIPEIVDVVVADEYELTDEANNAAI
ncbi:hypothetical protein HJC23_011113 [Cyclotella cryptica]|uniref:NIF system FeS cluster assembly NifU C-terminal domain-containing protein n=1 Tax=Cyclotella cryptica TaxID=29204 RepID=A0ABD3PWK9_9STRA|eukprot:CCRYP_011988-RA/>CCRYP_011988-RA protein AED:0.13 eAED:0.13 QI:222/1/1/1/1/1/4/34/209